MSDFWKLQVLNVNKLAECSKMFSINFSGYLSLILIIKNCNYSVHNLKCKWSKAELAVILEHRQFFMQKKGKW